MSHREELEATLRKRVVEEARSWRFTPYHIMGRIKGAGVDCMTFLIEVYRAAGIAGLEEFENYTPFYRPGFFLHRGDEIYLYGDKNENIPGMLDFTYEIQPPPKPADIVLYRFGRVFAHSAIVIDWPLVIHAFSGHGVMEARGDSGALARPKVFLRPKVFI